LKFPGFFDILASLSLNIPARSLRTLDNIGNIDSKYRFVILASKRAKQLLKGAKPKIKGKSRNLIRIAQAEVKSGLIDYEITPTGKDEIRDQDERVFVGAGIGPEEIVEPEVLSGKDVVDEEAGKADAESLEDEEGEEAEGADEEAEDGLKEDKDE
jgi:DNA-directed RNA polymerase omega subunit